jgi:hypothetical protein
MICSSHKKASSYQAVLVGHVKGIMERWHCLQFGVVQAEITGYLGEMAVLWRETASTMEGKKLWEGGQQRN